MSLSRSRDPDLEEPSAVSWSDLGDEDGAVLSLEAVLGRTAIVKAVAVPRRSRTQTGETPIMGEGAIARWLALHDRACEMRAALRPGDRVGERQVQRAIRSLFVYEHEITPKTRWQARVRLWERDQHERLPPFVDRRRWTRCRCSHCQAGVPRQWPVMGLPRVVACRVSGTEVARRNPGTIRW